MFLLAEKIYTKLNPTEKQAVAVRVMHQDFRGRGLGEPDIEFSETIS